MTKDELIKQCRYYKGQAKCPFSHSDIAWFWDMERVYVKNEGQFYGETELYHNLKGKKYKSIPYNLLMVMFTAWAKYETDIKENIEKFYKLVDLYLDFVSDHIPKDKVPT